MQANTVMDSTASVSAQCSRSRRIALGDSGASSLQKPALKGSGNCHSDGSTQHPCIQCGARDEFAKIMPESNVPPAIGSFLVYQYMVCLQLEEGVSVQPYK